MGREKRSKRHFRPTKLLRALYYYGGVDTRYQIALNVIKALQREGIRAPPVTNILKKIKTLQEADFYETIDYRDDLPVIRPSIKFRIYMAVDNLKILTSKLESLIYDS